MERLVQAAYYSNAIVKKQDHYHDCHQIILILKGNVQYCVNGAIQTGGPGQLAIFSRFENHSLTVCSEEYERYVLHIDPSADRRENRIYALLSNRPLGFCNVIDVSKELNAFRSLFERICGETDSDRILADDMQRLLVTELLIMIWRAAPQALNILEDDYFEMVADLQRQFEYSCAEQYTLGDLAKKYSISVSSLSHQFRRITGVAVMEYLLSCRLASAKRYLTGTNLGIGQIVERCGFSDSSNFSRTFRKQNGMSPTAFRERYKRT